MEQLVNFEIIDNRLKISLTDAGKIEIDNIISSDASFNEKWAKLCEYNFCNGAKFVDGSEVGALTEAPIISTDFEYIDEYIYHDLFWFPNYCIVDELEELRYEGYIYFESAMDNSDIYLDNRSNLDY